VHFYVSAQYSTVFPKNKEKFGVQLDLGIHCTMKEGRLEPSVYILRIFRTTATGLDVHVQQDFQDKVCVSERVAVRKMEWTNSRLRRCLKMLEVVLKVLA